MCLSWCLLRWCVSALWRYVWLVRTAAQLLGSAFFVEGRHGIVSDSEGIARIRLTIGANIVWAIPKIGAVDFSLLNVEIQGTHPGDTRIPCSIGWDNDWHPLRDFYIIIVRSR